jgi:hypothetical protein
MWPRQSNVGCPGVLTFAPVAFGATISAVATAVIGCAPNAPLASSGHGPTVICGTVMARSAAGPYVYDATRRLRTITDTTVGGVLMFRVARGCDHGSNVTWVPAASARLVKAAKARDGRTVAVVLKPSSPNAAFRLIAKRNSAVIASAIVKLHHAALR